MCRITVEISRTVTLGDMIPQQNIKVGTNHLDFKALRQNTINLNGNSGSDERCFILSSQPNEPWAGIFHLYFSIFLPGYCFQLHGATIILCFRTFQHTCM